MSEEQILESEDWVKSKAMIGEHPASPCMTKEVKYIGDEKVEEFIRKRVHEQNYLGTCEDVNTWYRPGKSKVKKVGNKNATKNFDNFLEAQRYASDLTSKTGNQYYGQGGEYTFNAARVEHNKAEALTVKISQNNR